MPQKKKRSAQTPAEKLEADGTKTETNGQNMATAPEVSAELLKEIGADAVSGEAAKPAKHFAPKKVDTTTSSDDTTVNKGETLSETDKTADLDDSKTDKAVDEIAEEEADTILALQDAAGQEPDEPSKGWKAKLKRILKNKWTWIGLLAILIVMLAVPFTRYKLIGIFIKEKVTITIMDSKTATPVSNATVKLAGRTGETSGDGKVSLRVPPGETTLAVTKQYYKSATSSYFVKLKASATTVKFTATGRQVPITVVNTITGQPVKGAEISALHTSAKTNAKGKATIVLPVGPSTDSGKVQLNGYNTVSITIQVTDQTVPANTFKLTPSGKVYFLSNTEGTIDVAKADLDGSGRQVVLAGTGKESATTTSLLASRDWRYVVLKAQRDGNQPALYLIDTNNDKVTTFDSSNAAFTPIGWYGHHFMYEAENNAVPQSQTGREALKSYDADRQQLSQLDQSQAESSAQGGYIYQHFYNFYVLNNLLSYNVQWYASAKGGDVTGKNSSIRGVQPDGQNKKDYQTFGSSGLAPITAVLYQPQAVYYDVRNASGRTYYSFANQTVNPVNISAAALNQRYPDYLVSPGGTMSFWIQDQAGQSSVFTGDANAGHQTQITAGSDYAPYGWSSDRYIIVSEGHNELLVIPATKAKTGWNPVKIGNYYATPPAGDGYSYGNF